MHTHSAHHAPNLLLARQLSSLVCQHAVLQYGIAAWLLFFCFVFLLSVVFSTGAWFSSVYYHLL
jgi:hypothetical protein